MRIIATTIISLRALRRNKLRSFLTALGIIIGVAAVIAMVSIGNGAKAQVEAQVANLGQNVVTVFPGSMTTGGARGGGGSANTLTVADALAIEGQVANVVAVSPELRVRAQLQANGLNWNTIADGESVGYPSIRAWKLASGEFFTENDVRYATKVCVIGSSIARELFPNSDPVGQTLRARNIPLKVLGVMESKGFNLFGADQDDCIIVPYSTAMTRLARRKNVSAILMEAASPEVMVTVQRDVTDLLTQLHGGRDPDFTVRNQLELAEAASATSKTMTQLLLCIALVSLMVGGIGIMNIMLVSVTERTREIGIRLAIGAHDRDIRLQFLIEAMILSVMGGILGVMLGVGISKALAHFNGWPILISETAIVLAVVFSGLVGIGFGFYPAHKAAKLDPIDALRYE